MYVISGDAGAGKDTVGAMLAEELKVGTYALATPIKALLKALFNIPEHQMEDRAYKELELTYHVDVTSLEEAGMLYNELGLDKYQEFHDAWEEWIALFGLEENGESMTTFRSLRTLMQLLGTEWGRSKSDTIWLDLAPESQIITDARFDNEAQYFKNKNYRVVEVVLPGLEKIPSSGHASEAGICPSLIDTVLINDGNLLDLRTKAITIAANGDGPLGVL